MAFQVFNDPRPILPAAPRRGAVRFCLQLFASLAKSGLNDFEKALGFGCVYGVGKGESAGAVVEVRGEDFPIGERLDDVGVAPDSKLSIGDSTGDGHDEIRSG